MGTAQVQGGGVGGSTDSCVVAAHPEGSGDFSYCSFLRYKITLIVFKMSLTRLSIYYQYFTLNHTI
jgi:hypothetical protein